MTGSSETGTIPWNMAGVTPHLDLEHQWVMAPAWPPPLMMGPDPRAMGLELGLGREGTSSAHAGEAPHATIDLP